MTQSRQFHDEGRDLAFQLYEEGERLIASWAVAEAAWLSTGIRDDGSSRYQFRNADLDSAYQDIASASLRDTILTLLRITDPQTPMTLFRASAIIQETRHKIVQPESQRAAEFIDKYVGNFDKNLVAKTWRCSDENRLFEKPYSVMKCRAELKRFRDATIVHGNDRSELGGLHLSRIRLTTLLAALAVEAIFFIFTGHKWQSIVELRRKISTQRRVRKSLTIDFIDHQTGPLARKIWERNAKSRSDL